MPTLIRGGLAMGASSIGREQFALNQDSVHGVELEVLEQAAQALRAALEVEVVPEARQGVCSLDPRLSRVDFPGMDVENEFLLLQIQPAERPAREPVWKQPEIAPACHRNL